MPSSGDDSRHWLRYFLRLAFFLFLLGSCSAIFAFEARSAAVIHTIDASGGGCAAIGDWDPGTLTCTMNRDLISDGIVINAAGVTLDGGGHTMFFIQGGAPHAVKINRKNNVTVRNMHIRRYQTGIYAEMTRYSTISSSKLEDISGNGIFINNSHSNLVENNQVVNDETSGEFSIRLLSATDNTISGNRTVFVDRSSDYVHYYSFRCLIESSSSNTIEGNDLGDSLELDSANNNILSGNNIHGISIYASNNNIISRNDMGALRIYATEDESTGNSVYQNNFSELTEYISDYSGGNAFYLPLPVGGNYYDNGNKTDLNGDHIVDSPIVFPGAVDALSWVHPNAWSDQTPPQVTAIQPTGTINAGSSVTVTVSMSDPAPSSGFTYNDSTVMVDGNILSCYKSSWSFGVADEITARITVSCNAGTLPPGPHTITGFAVDNMGNQAPIVGGFEIALVDDEAPQVTYTGPTGTHRARHLDVAASFADPDPSGGIASASLSLGGVNYKCSVTGTTSGTVSCTHASGFPTGSHTAVITVTDNQGNVGTATGNFSISPYVISDDAIGGECGLIGTWDQPTKTCTLATDVDIASSMTGIRIDDNDITLDGNGHSMRCSDSPSYLYWSEGIAITGNGVTVRNMEVSGCTIGTWLRSTDSARISGNYFQGNDVGAIIIGVNNTVTGNLFADNGHGVQVGNESAEWTEGTIIQTNLFYSNATGILLTSTADNLISGNYIHGNGGGTGIDMAGASRNTINHNTVTGHTTGTKLSGFLLFSYAKSSDDNVFYGNNFMDNTIQASVLDGSGNQFSIAAPAGGNHWSNFDSPGEGCDDADSNGFCDSPLAFAGGQDDLPRAEKDWPQKPVLGIGNVSPFWASFSDYTDRRLSVNISIENDSSYPAVDVYLVGMNATNGVQGITPMPHAVGKVDAFGSAMATVQFEVPDGVLFFKGLFSATAADPQSRMVTYP